MALTYPLSLTDFRDLFFVASATLVLDWRQELSGIDGSSNDLANDRAPAGWMLEVTTQDLTKDKSAAVRARFNALGGAMRTFMFTDPSLEFPSTDQDGSDWAGAVSPAVGTITNRRIVAFTGFPPDYVVPAGTYGQVTWDTSRKHLFQFAEDTVASGAGATAAHEIAPGLPEGINSGAAVTLYRPAAKFKAVPNSLRPSWTSGALQRLSFRARSTPEA